MDVNIKQLYDELLNVTQNSNVIKYAYFDNFQGFIRMVFIDGNEATISIDT